MFAYTLNLITWQMDQATEHKDEKPVKKTYKKRQEPELSFRDAFIEKYPDWYFIVDEFEKAIGHKASWRQLTRSNLVKFIDHLSSKFAPNTVNQYATRFKVVLNMYSEETKLPYSYSKLLSPRKIPCTSIYLNEEELKQLEDYQPKNDYELLVRNLFVCSAYCGARYIDILNMNKSNIRDNELVFVAQKTKKESRLPLKPVIAEYIKTMPKLEISDVGYNKIIRRICRNIGLTEPVKILKAGKEVQMEKCEAVSSHTARRSFATNLYLRGVDIYTISKLMQHSEIKLTSQYICANIRSLDSNALEYFS